MSPRLVILVSAALMFTGCTVTTDLGKSCVLKKTVNVTETRPDGTVVVTGTQVVEILQSEVAPGQDLIAFGITDCDDLICIQDAESPVDTAPGATAKGYCSRACLEGSGEEACEVTASGVVPGVESRMACRSLLLDTASLEALRRDDPVTYRKTFGETLSPFFCAGSLTLGADN